MPNPSAQELCVQWLATELEAPPTSNLVLELAKGHRAAAQNVGRMLPVTGFVVVTIEWRGYKYHQLSFGGTVQAAS